MGWKAGRISLHALLWLAVYIVPYLITYSTFNLSVLRSDPGSWLHIVSTILLVAYAYFNHYLLIPKLYLQRKYVVYVLAVVAAVLIVIWFPHLLPFSPGNGGPYVHHPFNELPPNGPPHGRPPSSEFSKMSYNIILFVICTFISINVQQQHQLLEVQKEKLNAELSFLKAQINPHFLFNTLNSIYALAIQKSDDTPQAVIQLSELMRYMLKDADSDMIPLDRELTYIGNYVALQKRRLGNTVQINYDAPINVTSLRVAPLILMSFVENAFKHGVNPDQDSAISMIISVQEKRLQLLVKNNKVTSVNSNETMGIGVKNAISRLVHLYPERHRLIIEDAQETYFVNLTLELND